jgi:hypothetical protein
MLDQDTEPAPAYQVQVRHKVQTVEAVKIGFNGRPEVDNIKGPARFYSI